MKVSLWQMMPESYELAADHPDGRGIAIFRRENGEAQVSVSNLAQTLWDDQYYYASANEAIRQVRIWLRMAEHEWPQRLEPDGPSGWVRRALRGRDEEAAVRVVFPDKSASMGPIKGSVGLSLHG